MATEANNYTGNSLDADVAVDHYPFMTVNLKQQLCKRPSEVCKSDVKGRVSLFMEDALR